METHFSLNALFPSLDIANVTAQNVPEERATDMDAMQSNSESPNADLLWQDVDNLSIPDSPQLQQKDNDIIISQNPTSAQSHQSSLASTVNSTSSPSTESSSATAATAAAAAAAAAVFNISWGGNDKPPAELHLDRKDEAETMVSRKPLPKPRGVKRLPEPEPAEDGTLDEETLRRRRVCNRKEYQINPHLNGGHRLEYFCCTEVKNEEVLKDRISRKSSQRTANGKCKTCIK